MVAAVSPSELTPTATPLIGALKPRFFLMPGIADVPDRMIAWGIGLVAAADSVMEMFRAPDPAFGRAARGGMPGRTAAPRRHTVRRGGIAAMLLSLCMLLAACGTPVSVQRRDARAVDTELTSNALTTGRLSGETTIVLRRLDLLDLYAANPEAALSALRQIVTADSRNPDLLFALAEMSFLHGEKKRDRSWFLASVVYSYAFLFPRRRRTAPIRSTRGCVPPPTSTTAP